MKKWISRLLVSLAICLSSVTQSLNAFDCCYDFSDFSCDGALKPQVISIQVKGGVVPTHFTERERVWLANPLFFPTLFSFYRIPKFDKQFSTPWEVAVEAAFNFCSNGQLFLEGVYQQGEAKFHDFRVAGFRVGEKFENYRTLSGYLGVRYFFDKWLCSVSPFVGFKAGFVNNRKIKFRYSLNDNVIVESTYYHGNTGPSVGLQVGFDYNMCANWNAVLTFEAVATQGLKSNKNVVIPAFAVRRGYSGGATNLVIGDTGYLVSFPITLGLRYDF